MNRDIHVSSIAARLGSRTDLNQEIIDKMKSIQQYQLEGAATLPWFLIETVSLVLPVGDSSVALPAGFLRMVEDGVVRIYPTATPTDIEELTTVYLDPLAAAAADAGKPESVTFFPDSVLFDKQADVSYTVYFAGYTRDVVLETDVENDWLKFAGDLMEAEVMLKMAVRIQSPAIVKEAKEEIALARDRLWRMHEARRNAGEGS